MLANVGAEEAALLPARPAASTRPPMTQEEARAIIVHGR
jgi:hypothetical protein